MCSLRSQELPLRLFHRATNVSADVWQKFNVLARLHSIEVPAAFPIYGKVTLNAEQQKAVTAILPQQQTPIVVHGPPGTG